ncbi:MAG: DUF2062 domain-containing protein [Bacteroidota bacterium]|nr:DUF2062 domain-containing protein [Bacteroidota bacterium]
MEVLPIDDQTTDPFGKASACVLIPTYNNATTLGRVINDVAKYTRRILVVNDGSTDDTPSVLQQFPFITLVNLPQNQGKGMALRTGFQHAVSLGYQYVISIDSDGQHFAADLQQFLEKLATQPNSIIVGARNMDQASVPGGSSFGNRFSNFWFKVETGIRLPDTQSGYRVYPVAALDGTRWVTRRFEFEIEVLVRAAWKGIPVVPVPVKVYYAPAGERVSHFRPFKDFARISVLNTVLVLLRFLYIIPRNFIRDLFSKEKRRSFINDHLLNPAESDLRKAASIAFGVFMGIVPLWGFQLVIAIFLSIWMRLNKALVIIAANISIPPMIPFIIYGSYKMGAMWMGNRAMDLVFSKQISLQDIKANLEQYIYGSITLSVIAALAAGAGSYLLMKIFRRKTTAAA